MSADLITLRNISPNPQQIFWKGRQLIMQPYAEEFFEATIAEYFIETRKPFIEKADFSATSVFTPPEEKKTMWVANISGDPDAPKTVKVPFYNRQKKMQDVTEVVNPQSELRHITREMAGADVFYTSQDGSEASKTLAPTTYELPPFKRVELPLHVGKWFLQRGDTASRLEKVPPIVIKSRPPSDFEPTGKWPIDHMRLYLQMMDPRITDKQLGPTEAEIKRKWGNSKTQNEVDGQMRLAKSALWKRLTRRLMDPKFELPTQDQFNDMLAAKKNPTVAAAEAAELKATEASMA